MVVCVGMVGASTGGCMGYIGVIYDCGDFREPATATRVGRSKRKRGVVAFGKRCSRVLVPVVWQLRRGYGARGTRGQRTVTQQSHSRQSHQGPPARATAWAAQLSRCLLSFCRLAVLPSLAVLASCRLSVATHGDASASDATEEDAKHLIWRSQRLASCLNRRAWRLKNGRHGHHRSRTGKVLQAGRFPLPHRRPPSRHLGQCGYKTPRTLARRR